MKVGILTTFYRFDPGYSLCQVVWQQLAALVKHGYQPVLFVLENWDKNDQVPEGVELRPVIPQLILEPYAQGNLSKLEEDIARAKEAMEKHMADIDVCLTHDIIFINSYLPYNIAMRRAIDGALGKVRWLHWMHSGPSRRPVMDGSPWDNLYTLPKNSKLVYMNYTDTVRAAEMYGLFVKDVRTIFNPMDVRILYNFHPVTRRLIEAHDLMTPEYLCVYPLSTTRMGEDGKQLKKVISVMAGIKKLGNSVALVIPNAHANATREKIAIEEMYAYGYECGLERREIVFTSLFEAPDWESGVPHDVVRDLFTLGNLFIFPSVSENCPLVLLEAMAGGNILVLNKNFPAMKDFCLEGAYYFEFGSLVESVNYHNGIQAYMDDVAKIIVSEYQNNKAVKSKTKLRRQFNCDYIATHQLLPAIQEIHES